MRIRVQYGESNEMNNRRTFQINSPWKLKTQWSATPAGFPTKTNNGNMRINIERELPSLRSKRVGLDGGDGTSKRAWWYGSKRQWVRRLQELRNMYDEWRSRWIMKMGFCWNDGMKTTRKIEFGCYVFSTWEISWLPHKTKSSRAWKCLPRLMLWRLINITKYGSSCGSLGISMQSITSTYLVYSALPVDYHAKVRNTSRNVNLLFLSKVSKPRTPDLD